MKSLLALLFVAIASFGAVTDAAPCDKAFFHALCNPSLKAVESCYDCYRLDKDKQRCVPIFKKLDLTDFMSDKRWNCTQHEWENHFHSDEYTESFNIDQE